MASESPSTRMDFITDGRDKTRTGSTPLEEEIQPPEPINKDIGRVRRKILISPEPATEVSFCTISPIRNKKEMQEKGKGRGKRSKQHSIILTFTPMKTLLENKEEKKTMKKEKEDKAKDILKQSKRIIKKEKTVKNLLKGEFKKDLRKAENAQLLLLKLMKKFYVEMMMIVMVNFMMKVNQELMNCA